MTVALNRSGAATAARERPQNPATPPTSGSLAVDSRPAGAQVFVDGALAGTTPLSLPQINAGDHAIRLERDGYRRWSSSVRIISGERNRVTASLER